MRTRPILALALLAAARLAGAQSTPTAGVADSVAAGEPERLLGVSVGLPGYGRETALQLATVGVQYTAATVGTPGLDLALGTMPYAMAMGVVPLGLRLGVALPLALGADALLLPSAGLSAVGGASGSGAGGVVGYNTGAGVAVIGRDGSAFRLGVTLHKFQGSNGAVWLVETGFARARRRAPR